MKQNKYDDPDFFDQYSKMPRSVEGLNAAGEWYVLREMLGDLQGKNMLDLGCGYGWHCLYARKQGAKRVVGVDISAKMLERARKNAHDPAIEYRQMAIEDIQFQAEEFDIVLSSLALHYIKDFDVICRKVNHCLTSGGSFIFSMEHPVFTAIAKQDWHYDTDGNRLHWPVDDYQLEGPREAQFLGHKVIKYHRTMATIVNSLIESGFAIKRIAEPQPTQEILTQYPEMKDEVRRPIFILIYAVKTPNS